MTTVKSNLVNSSTSDLTIELLCSKAAQLRKDSQLHFPHKKITMH